MATQGRNPKNLEDVIEKSGGIHDDLSAGFANGFTLGIAQAMSDSRQKDVLGIKPRSQEEKKLERSCAIQGAVLCVALTIVFGGCGFLAFTLEEGGEDLFIAALLLSSFGA